MRNTVYKYLDLKLNKPYICKLKKEINKIVKYKQMKSAKTSPELLYNILIKYND